MPPCFSGLSWSSLPQQEQDGFSTMPTNAADHGIAWEILRINPFECVLVRHGHSSKRAKPIKLIHTVDRIKHEITAITKSSKIEAEQLRLEVKRLNQGLLEVRMMLESKRVKPEILGRIENILALSSLEEIETFEELDTPHG